jgi:soluble lytic murein transglycosylase-like protein
MSPRSLTALLSSLAVLGAALPVSGASADATVTTTSTTEAATATQEVTNVPAPAAAEPPAPSTSTPAPATSTEAAPVPVPVPGPEVRAQRRQPRTALAHPHASPGHKPGQSSETPAEANTKAVAPSALTPPLPSTLGGAVSGIPSFFIDSFSIPPFLLPIYQAAGAAYGIPWQVLAAINEVETDYGRDLNVSSAGAEGWMQFLPSTWGQYGVDVNSDGFQDPYNPADAIFAAARYLKAAGGDKDIRGAVFSYNHSQSYVNSVLLRARLLGGTPPQLLGAITGLTEARFPVYAASHYSDAFPLTEGSSPHTVAGTTIYSQDAAPVIAVQDGRIVRISPDGPLGRSISLRDTYGNTYTYAELGTLASLYPVLEASRSQRGHATGSGFSPAAQGATRKFRAGSEDVYLHPLRVGAQVIAGTVLGHVGPGAEPHIVFQINPAGTGAPLIDPKPILDGWVKLQSSSAVKAKGRDPFPKLSPTPGQALLESKTQLQLQVPRNHDIHLAACMRRLIVAGRADRRVLAALEFLAASGLKPTVSAQSCAKASSAAHIVPSVSSSGEAVDISAINGHSLAGASGYSSLAGFAVRKLAGLQGVMKPLQIASATHIAGVPHVVTSPGYAGVIHISYAALGAGKAHAAGVPAAGLTPAQWLKLVARLGEVPDPAVAAKPSSSAIPDRPSSTSSSTGEGP